MNQSLTYDEFLKSKITVADRSGFEVDAGELHPALFPFQRDLTAWAVRKGRAAIFADTEKRICSWSGRG